MRITNNILIQFSNRPNLIYILKSYKKINDMKIDFCVLKVKKIILQY